MGTGWDARLEILRRDAENDLLGPLRTHKWEAAIDREVERGEYLLITAKRGGHQHSVLGSEVRGPYEPKTVAHP